MRRPVDEVVRRIVGAIYPILQPVITGPQSKVIHERVRAEVEGVVVAMRAEGDARKQTADNEAHASTEAAVAAARAEEQKNAAKALTDAVAAARRDEQQKAQQAVAAAQTAAATAQANAVADARIAERARIVGEIQIAPVTGITVTLLGNVRQQIKTYVQNGPYA